MIVKSWDDELFIADRPWRRLERHWHTVEPWQVHSRILATRAPAGAPWAVLVHGLGVSGRYMTPLALALAHRFRVVVPDLPGHGRTKGPDNVLGVRDQAEVLGRWLAAAGIDGPHVIAHSLGCQVVVQLAGEPDADVRSLVLVGPAMDPAARSAVWQATRLARTMVHEPWPLVRLLAAEYLHRPAQAVTELRTALDHDEETSARRVRAPSLVLRGARDRVAPPEWVGKLTRWLPDARAVDLPIGAHAVHASHPCPVASLVDG